MLRAVFKWSRSTCSNHACRRRRKTRHASLEQLEPRTLLATNVLNVNASWSSNGQAGSLSGTISVDTDTGRLNGLSLNRAGGNMANASYAFDAVTLQGFSDSSAYSLTTAARGSYELRMTWVIPTGSLATYTGGSVSSFSFTSPTLGMFITGQTGAITNRNDAPIDVSLSSAVVAENLPAGSPVGTLSASDPDIGNTFTYSLVSGTGSNDNASFAIAGKALKTAASFNHEDKRSYSIRVRATDQDGLSTERSFSITVADVVELPTLGQLAALTVQKNSGEASVNLTGIAAGDSLVPVRVTAQSSDPSLVPHPAVDYVSRTFATSATISTGTVRTYGVAVGDFNGDGRMDIAANSATNGTLSVVFGDGVGGFSTPAAIAVGYEPYFVIADDFNKDGIDDVAVSNFESNLITVRLGSPSGAFLASKSFESGKGMVFPASTGVWYLATGDLNGDGNRDLVSSNIRHDFISVLLGDGAGGFGASAKVGVGGVGVPVPHQTGPYGAVIKDFNGDGKQDVAVAVMGEDVVRILDGVAGAGGLSVVKSIAVGDAPKGLAAGDFNSDGRVDLAVANTGAGTVTILRGDGLGGFIVSSTIPGGSGTTEVAAVDLDRDGNLDLVTSSKQGRVFRLNGGGDGTFGSPEAFVLGPTTQDQTFSVVKDLNGDGFPDITTVGEIWNQIPGDIDVLLSQAVSTGTLKVTPVPGKSGTATVSVTVEDGGPDRNLATSADNNSVVRTFTVTVVDPNSAPTDISLAGSSVPENDTSGALVGTLSTADANSGNTFTYTLVTGTGSTDNAAFNISGNQLRATASLNFETKSSYSVRVRSTDQGGLFTEKAFTITVTNVNEAPTDIALSASSIAENAGANAVVGTLSTTDPDAGNTFTYTLVTGTGSTDNAAFNISGNQLRATASLNFEAKSSYIIRVRATDQGGLFTEKAFTITVTNVNEAPTDIALSTSSIAENAGANALVGTLSTTDPDAGNTFTYSLVSGTGSTDNAAFTITANQLAANASFDFETKNSYAVRVRSTDQDGLFTEKPFTISVTDVNEAALFSFGFKHVNQVGADSYLVDSTGMRKYSEWQNPPITYWGPAANNAEGRLVYKFPFSMPTSSMRLLAHSPSWDFFNEPGGYGRGASALEVSKDGSNWISLRNSLEPRQWGVDWTYNEALPSTVLGGNELWVRMRFYVESAPNSSYTDAQFGRSTSAATANVFEVQATFASNRAPQNIALSTSSIAENAGADAAVGTLSTTDPDAGNTFTYALVSGTGDTDNAAFKISGNQLRADASLDFETKSSYSIRIRSTDQGGLFTEKAFTIAVSNVNETPTAVALSAASIAENAGANAVVGTLSTTDPDAGNTFTYTLVTGTGSTDNAAFNISNNQLRATSNLDFETRSSYSVRVRSTDQGGLFAEKIFTIDVTAIVEVAPFVFGFKHVNEAGADAYLIDSTGMRKYSEWQNPAITYWGPSANGSEGRLVYKFPFPQSSHSIRLRASDASWDFFKEAGGDGRGASSLEVSKDGVTWISLRNSLEPRKWGADWAFDDNLPPEVLGAGFLWVRMRFYVESAPNTSYTVAQFGRSTSGASKNVFELQAELVKEFVVSTGAGNTETPASPFNGDSRVVKQGPGTLVLDKPNTHRGGTVVESGEVVVRNAGAVGTGKLTVKAGAFVTFDVHDGLVPVEGIVMAPGSRVDLGYAKLAIGPGGYDLGVMKQLLRTSYKARWAGSSTAITTRSVDNVTGGNVGWRLEDDGSLMLGFAANGDTNLDGYVDLYDVADFTSAGKYNTDASAGWFEGDFNYDGIVDVLDVMSFVSTRLLNRGGYVPPATPVPAAAATLTPTETAFLAFAIDASEADNGTKARKNKLYL
ncbi:MAG: hypothetical protein FJ286_14445 [Planctomycetes bacterium]|nr:hypothetical protein [Planctomycetota bacterium]